MPDKTEFPYDRWDELKALMESDGTDTVVAHIEAHEDLLKRRKLYLFAASAFAHNEWEGKNLDALIAIAGSGIREGLREASDEVDAEVAARRKDFANVLSYNLSASLADCWPDDPFPRERRHLEAGLRAAEDCVRWRDELEKGPGPKSMANWALGMHRLSLGDLSGSREAFALSLEQARAAATEREEREVPNDEDFATALGEGYLGISEDVLGEGGSASRFEAACSAFERMSEDAEKKDDAEFGLSQLREARKRYPRQEG